MAQAIAFRAFGAEPIGFDTDSEIAGLLFSKTRPEELDGEPCSLFS
jgi:hypothetical protein